jgi:thiol-disulfide isomerase/thioredoxin
MLRKLEEPWTATLVMGTWCGDTHREIPRFYRILDEMGVSDQSITLIAVDRTMQADGLDLEDLEIERIPTFIFYKKGKEVGRIVENARETLEDDMLLILSRPSLPAAPDGPNPLSQ